MMVPNHAGVACSQKGECSSHSHCVMNINSDVIRRQVAKILFNDPTLNREYLPIAGLPEFTSTAACLILGADSVAIGEKQVASMQTISGTGANHLGASFFGRFRIFNGAEQIYLSEPTWGELQFALQSVKCA